MSGLINKAKEVLHSDKKDNAATDHPSSTNAGPHGSNLTNKADPRVDSDRDTLGTTHGGAATHGAGTGAGYGSTTTGTTGAGYGSTHTGTTGAGYGNDPRSTNAGPHGSNFVNQADPRIDSDRDGRGPLHGTNTAGGAGYGSTHTGTTGAGYGSTHTGTTGAGYGEDSRSANAGPHSSNLANKIDPRVDSDRDGRGPTHGTSTTGAGYGGTHTGTTGAGYGSTTTGTGYGASGPGNPHSSTAGPHGSNFANQADPRIDSDLDGGRRTGFGPSGAGHTGADYAGTNQPTTGAGYGSATTGSAGAAHAHGAGSALPGSGNASNTAGPHNSNLLNKLDPRVDSDLDGSKTTGGNATHK